MKQVFFYFLFIINVVLFGKEYVPEYSITKSEADKTLKKTEALFIITIKIMDIVPIKKQIIYAYNNVQKKQVPNEKGQLNVNVKPGKYLFKFFYDKNHSEVITDSILIKPGYRTEMEVELRNSDMPIIVEKPVIYVYGKDKVSIQLNLKGALLFTYPEYTNGWNFTANPNGVIEMGDKKYHYLFWDGKLEIPTTDLDLKKGFMVDKNNLVSFFEEKLTLMGLNTQETEDFITYWCPRMSVNEKNYVHFMFNEEYNNYASITIDPKPDQLFRVCMLWSKTNNNTTKVKPQKIESFKRDGFTVVEWGGTEMQELSPCDL
ncbi:MAG: hypothetical protein ABIP51_05830 [Bacteroidia bacterium]